VKVVKAFKRITEMIKLKCDERKREKDLLKENFWSKFPRDNDV